jgi:tRNA synthetases class I (I, L, M and V)
VQDVVTRYASQTGHHVERRFGWDCHGLPVEFEIDKKLGAASTAPIQLQQMHAGLWCEQTCARISPQDALEFPCDVKYVGNVWHAHGDRRSAPLPATGCQPCDGEHPTNEYIVHHRTRVYDC